MAEGEGFEPSVARATSVFKTGALNQTLPPLRWREFSEAERFWQEKEGLGFKFLWFGECD